MRSNWCPTLFIKTICVCVCVCAWTTFLYSHNKRLTSYDSTRIDINCIPTHRPLSTNWRAESKNWIIYLKTTTNLPSIDFLQTCNRYRYTSICRNVVFCIRKQASNVSRYFIHLFKHTLLFRVFTRRSLKRRE